MTRSKAHRHGREPSFHKLHGLMPFMVREILLCSSAYDAFLLEEDGRLEERLFSAYDALSLSLAPRITHATTAAESLELLAGRHFDLVITVVRLQDTDAADLSRRIHALDPRLPIVLLAFDEADPHSLPGGVLPSGIDRVFLWTGDARILIAAIKLVEDARNADHDSQSAGVPIILVVEDSPRRYSSFLALLYAELMAQSQSLIAEGLNAIHRLMRMRARPKIVLATSYEEALALYHRHEDHLLAVLSDVRFPRAGREDPEAGLALVRTIHAAHPELPLLLQSADGGFEKPAAELGAWNVSKNSPTLLAQIRRFLKEALGFGDFVFRKPDGTEVGRAHDLYELERLLRKVPPDSLEFHARANHFSLWLKARTMFSLAREVRPRTAGEFEDIEAIRRYLLEVLHRELSQEEEGLIADFVPTAAPGRQFVRLGRGSIGGKGRGIAFANSFLVQHGFDAFEELDIRIPRTLAIAVDEFDRFLERSNMNRDELIGRDDPALIRRFLAGELHPELRTHLVHALETFTGPLAVRSSSLLEDSRFQPFAGIYATYMLPNNHPDPDVRLSELRSAIKAVYASTFSASARAYLQGTAHALDEEKMAVVIQEVAGSRFGDRFYPHLAGVAQSRNFYPVGGQRAEDGVAIIALGLGHTVVSGGSALRFSPQSPTVLPQFPTPRDFYRRSQNTFLALDLGRPQVDFATGPLASIVTCKLEQAESDGSLALAGSTWSTADDAIRDTLKAVGPRLITFNNVLKWGAVPLAPALARLLSMFRQGVGAEVEIEFALELATPPEVHRPRLCVVQMRPMAALDPAVAPLDEGEVAAERILCRTARSLGRGRITSIRDIVYVRPGDLDGRKTAAAAAQVGQLNRTLGAEGRHYLLIGPGRWGSSDPTLGIPVDWSQISAARVIVETPMANRSIEPSQGTHFFHNVTALHIAYLTVGGPDELLDQAWLDAQPAVTETPTLRHIRLPTPLDIRLSGPDGSALALKPE